MTALICLTFVALAQSALIAFLLIDRRAERQEVSQERAMLMLRVQAPEAAVQQQLVERPLPPSPMPVGIENDDIFNETREQLAERLARIDG